MSTVCCDDGVRRDLASQALRRAGVYLPVDCISPMPVTRARRRKLGLAEEEVQDVPVVDQASTNGKSTQTTNGEELKADAPAPPAVPENKERKRAKIVTRVTYGALMVAVYLGLVLAGHMYIFSLVLVIQVMLFKELVKVRYNKYVADLSKVEKKVPLFRTLQWAWFIVALFYTHSTEITKWCQESKGANHAALRWVAGILLPLLSFWSYVGAFVASVLTLRPGLYKYQVGQLAWTVVILCLIVGQLKVSGPNIFNGIFWFFFPACCIIINDIMAYFCGIAFGKRFIHRPFLSISPNKTWEGFLGALIFTCLFAVWFSGFVSHVKYLTCSVNDLGGPGKWTPFLALHQAYNRDDRCIPDVFAKQMIDLKPLKSYVSHYVAPPVADLLMPWESLPIKPIRVHALAFAIFGSLVAPFGGFLMSAIKRAYEIKDFDSIIPGHGGVTDRMDCQLVMILFTSVYFDAFIGREDLSPVEAVVEAFTELNGEQQHQAFGEIQRYFLNATEPH